jgi:transposase
MARSNRRHEVSEREWALLAPLLPPRQTRGRHYRDHRTILNGILWVLGTGAPWRDLPRRYGPWETVYGRFRRWARDGTFARVLQAVAQQVPLDWGLWAIDGSSVRAHKAAAGAGKKPGRG